MVPAVISTVIMLVGQFFMTARYIGVNSNSKKICLLSSNGMIRVLMQVCFM